MVNTQLIFCDESELFRRPAEPAKGESFSLFIWVPASGTEEQVSFCFHEGLEYREIQARKAAARGLMDIYEAAHPGTEGPLYYYAKIIRDDEIYYYGRNGVRPREEIIAFSLLPEYRVPDWARGALWYQIFPDRFCNGDPSNDVLTGEIYDDVGLVSRKMDWQDPVTPLDVHHYYGGDLQGILLKLDYLKQLGVEVLYLNPVFVAPSSHKYNTQDYEHVDPHLGVIHKDGEGESRYAVRTLSEANQMASDALLARLIREAHERDIKVVLDGVFNHCSSFHRWHNAGHLYDGAAVRSDFFRQNETGEPECWWGNGNLLKLDIDGSRELEEYLLGIAEKWLSAPYHADGWRLDVAADLGHSLEANHGFWEKFRCRVKAIRPDAMILAEHYGDPGPWLMGNQWDSVMNYDAFMDPVSWFFTGMEKHSDEYRDWMEGRGDIFRRSMEEAMARLPRPALECALNQLDNHDHSRFLTRTNHKVGRLGELGWRLAEEETDKALLRAAVLLQMTWPGSPGIYYGDEAGLAGFTDPDNRRPYPWGREDHELMDYYTNLICLRRQFPMLKTASLRILRGEEGLLVYGRMKDGANMLVVINQSNTEKSIDLDIRELDGLGVDRALRLLQSDAKGYNMGRQQIELPDGHLSLQLGPRECLLYQLASEEIF